MNEQVKAICAEIERMKYPTSIKEAAAIQDVLNDLLNFIDSLPEEKPSKDLEEAAEKWCKENGRGFVLRDKSAYYIGETLPAFKAGAQWQKEQIMDEAIEGEVQVVTTKAGWRHSFQVFAPYDGEMHTGQKVIIIVKEDEQ